jgi:hypothetical protein
MPNIPESQRADMPEFPDEALDALLTGDLPTEDATAGLQPVAALLAALTAAPEGGELAGHARALAQFRRRDGMPVHSRHTMRRRSRLLTSLLSAKAAAAAVAAVAAVGGAATAAFAGALPAPAQQFAHNTIGAPSPKPSHGPASHPVGTPSGPDATGPAAFGLCTAYSHAKTHGTASQKAVAFRNLAAAAGGTANITAYCATVPHPGSSQASAAASAAASHAPSHPTSKPSSHPAGNPSAAPTSHPTSKPSSLPTSHPTGKPATAPAHN